MGFFPHRKNTICNLILFHKYKYTLRLGFTSSTRQTSNLFPTQIYNIVFDFILRTKSVLMLYPIFKTLFTIIYVLMRFTYTALKLPRDISIDKNGN